MKLFWLRRLLPRQPLNGMYLFKGRKLRRGGFLFFSSWERSVKGYPMKGKEFRRGRVGEEKDGDDT